MFSGVKQLLPGCSLKVKNGKLQVGRYWDVEYGVDWETPKESFHTRLRDLTLDSIDFHLRSDVPIGAYVSGGLDSSLMSILAARKGSENRQAFHGRFCEYPGYDESHFAKLAVESSRGNFNLLDINHEDFRDNIEKVIYHLDFPVGGPGFISAIHGFQTCCRTGKSRSWRAGRR